MKLIAILVVALFCQQATTQLISIPKGFGFVEDKKKNKKRCIDYSIPIECEESQKFCEMLTEECKTEKNRRKKREPTLIIVGSLVVAGIALGVGAFNFLWYKSITDELERNVDRHEIAINDLERITDRLERTDKVNYRMLANVTEYLSKQEMNHVFAVLFAESGLEHALRFFEQEPRKLLDLFNYDPRIGFDVMKQMEYTFKCGAAPSDYILEVCDTWNPDRRFGEVKMTAPVGNFVNHGTVFRYYDSPKMSVFVDDKIVPTDHCVSLGTDWSCEQASDKSCSLANFDKCKLVTEITRNGVFSMELDDVTYIATTQKHYALFENGTSKNPSYRDVPATGRFLFKAPHDTKLVIGGDEFYGRHDTLSVEAVALFQDLPGLTHEEVDEIEKRYAEIETDLELLKKHMTEIRHSVGWGASISDFFAYLPMYLASIWKTIVSIATLISIVLLVIGLFWLWNKCCRRKKSHRSDKNLV